MATKVTRQGLGSRLGNAIKGIFIGIILFLGSFVLLWWNEGNAVTQYKNINEVRIAAVEIDPAAPPADSDRLVHVSGDTQTPDILEDPEFGLQLSDTIHLERRVEMYQWEESSTSETRTKLGGGQETVTNYSYSTTWSRRPIDSSRFYEQDPTRRNPGAFPVQERSVSASNVTVGNLTLTPAIISQISGLQPLSISGDLLDFTPGPQRHLQGSTIYIGTNPASPEVGDLRIQFLTASTGPVSIIAGQQGDRLNTSWTTSSGRAYSRVQTGTHTKDAMLDQAEQEVKMLTWILRFVGWLLMSAGLGMVLQPLRVISDVLPFLGRLVGAGLGLISGMIAAVLSLITIAIAWVAVRPLIGIPLLIVALAIFIGVIVKAKKADPAPTPAPAAG